MDYDINTDLNSVGIKKDKVVLIGTDKEQNRIYLKSIESSELAICKIDAKTLKLLDENILDITDKTVEDAVGTITSYLVSIGATCVIDNIFKFITEVVL